MATIYRSADTNPELRGWKFSWRSERDNYTPPPSELTFLENLGSSSSKNRIFHFFKDAI